jgi:hypothetical protein
VNSTDTEPDESDTEPDGEVEASVEEPGAEVEPSEDADEVEPGDDTPAPARQRKAPWAERRIVLAAAVAVVCLAIAGALAFAGRSGGGGGGGDDSDTPLTMPSSSVNTGGIEVDAPDGWTAAPLPQFGFGIAVPPGWEATVLAPEMLNSLNRSDPAVTGFVDAAHAAAEAGAVFYAAGQDRQGRVTDLKVRAAPEAGVEDIGGLEDYARQLATEPGVGSPRIERVDGADRPTVRLSYRTTAESEEGDRITSEGIETLILGPGDVVWSAILTSEDRAILDDLAPRILDTLTLARPR